MSCKNRSLKGPDLRWHDGPSEKAGRGGAITWKRVEAPITIAKGASSGRAFFVGVGMPKNILDPCCGSKMMYFDKSDDRILYADKRHESHVLCDGRVMEVNPDLLCDYQNLPFQNDAFALVVFDPPHIERAGPLSWQARKYGKLDKHTWRHELRHAFLECWRVLKSEGTLIFKWSEVQIPLSRVLSCFPETPVFGHTTTTNLKTHWMIFFKSSARKE